MWRRAAQRTPLVTCSGAQRLGWGREAQAPPTPQSAPGPARLPPRAGETPDQGPGSSPPVGSLGQETAFPILNQGRGGRSQHGDIPQREGRVCVAWSSANNKAV